MSNPESFIDEVSEEVRRDKLFKAMRKYGWIPVLLIVALVGGTSWSEYRKAQSASAAQAYGDALFTALEQNEAADRVDALSGIETPAGAEALTAFVLASQASAAGDTQAAITALEAIANNPDTEPTYRDLARLRLVMVGANDMTEGDRVAALQGLIQGAGPLALLAAEQRALIEVQSGRTDDAIATLTELVAAADASAALRQRAAQLIVALGGDVPEG